MPVWTDYRLFEQYLLIDNIALATINEDNLRRP